jgi:hypothetical protein
MKRKKNKKKHFGQIHCSVVVTFLIIPYSKTADDHASPRTTTLLKHILWVGRLAPRAMLVAA